MKLTTELRTGLEARLAARSNAYTSQTSGVAPTYIQANLIVLPSRYADDFRKLCLRNPVPCPLLAESMGSPHKLKSYLPGISDDDIARDLDITRDAPRYMMYQGGRLVQSEILDITKYWTEDHVGFLIGCSYSFETALTLAGLPPAHTIMRRNVPMYRTSIPLCPSGVFTGGTYVVSMRPYKVSDVQRVRDITCPFLVTHGEPIAWGWKAVKTLGIVDISKPEWGDAPFLRDGKPMVEEDEFVPVFWGCGVTPQNAVMSADLGDGIVMGHAPGHMIVLDIREDDIFK
jgi:uncharacterized protein YcsI (UPF0317 family)